MKHNLTYKTLKAYNKYSDGQSYPYYVVINFDGKVTEERVVELHDGINYAMLNAAQKYLNEQEDVSNAGVTPF